MAIRFLQNALLTFYSKKIAAILSVEVDTKSFLNNDFVIRCKRKNAQKIRSNGYLFAVQTKKFDILQGL